MGSGSSGRAAGKGKAAPGGGGGQAQAAPSPPAASFADAFRRAFDRLPGARDNFVHFADLREALPQFTREQFDRGVKDLIRSREFSAESYQSQVKPATPRQRAAAIEIGPASTQFAATTHIFHYISRR